MRGEGGEEVGGGGREWKRRAESGDGRGRPVGEESDERGEGGITANESDEPNIDWRGDGGAVVAGDSADVGPAGVASVVGLSCCRFARVVAASVGSAGGRAVCPSRLLESASRAIASAAADKPVRSSVPGAGVTNSDGVCAVDCC